MRGVMTKQHEEIATQATISTQESFEGAASTTCINPAPDQVLEYIGSVSNTKNEKLFAEIKKRMSKDPEREIFLTITSGGGPTGAAMSLYGMVRKVLKPHLTTIGMGDVDSSGLIVLLSGERRYVSRGTTALLHMAGRRFDPYMRFTAQDLEAMAREDQLKDAQYAQIIADNSRGILTASEVLAFMKRDTVFSAQELVAHGLSDAILAA